MSTAIEWTHIPGYKGETWNPVVGCTKVSQGCKHCYAETLHNMRHKAYLGGKLQNMKQYAQPFGKVQTMPHRLSVPLKAKKPTCYFVNSMSDLFHEDVPFGYIDQVFERMESTPWHLFLILTKRPERMAEYLSQFKAVSHPEFFGDQMMEREDEHGATYLGMKEHWPLKNVWLGTSVEDQKTADERIPHLLRCPAAVRFLSCEPLLGLVDIERWMPHEYVSEHGHDYATARYGGGESDEEPACAKCGSMTSSMHWTAMAKPQIDWVIAGGESGKGARPMHPDWARGLRDQCKAAGVPFFFKQWGEHVWGDVQQRVHRVLPPQTIQAFRKVGKKAAGHLLDGVEHFAWPEIRLTSGSSPVERSVKAVAP